MKSEGDCCSTRFTLFHGEYGARTFVGNEKLEALLIHRFYCNFNCVSKSKIGASQTGIRRPAFENFILIILRYCAGYSKRDALIRDF